MVAKFAVGSVLDDGAEPTRECFSDGTREGEGVQCQAHRSLSLSDQLPRHRLSDAPWPEHYLVHSPRPY